MGKRKERLLLASLIDSFGVVDKEFSFDALRSGDRGEFLKERLSF